MNILIRCDSSIEIGTGHMMRCLTLATALTEQEVQCEFICREHDGNMIEYTEAKGFQVYRLPVFNNLLYSTQNTESSYAAWLGTSQEQDAIETINIIKEQKIDWLIVDHYALDETWEKLLRPYCKKIMVLDDLANRRHECDLLLDQNLGRVKEDYHYLVPKYCHIFIGPEYALLRPEFTEWREYSLKRRIKGDLKRLLINLGGVDKDNVTSQVLTVLQEADLPKDLEITVIMGNMAPYLEQVKDLASKMPRPTQVLVGVGNMAEVMANSDLAIGAAGSTSWERCCLGLPTLVMVLAENQSAGAKALYQQSISLIVNSPNSLIKELTKITNIQLLKLLSHNASTLTKGMGVKDLVDSLKRDLNV
ncbi:UDP-2,4-diacetamido-2,4,6-trideoxy-beta-L-altropyranose hydrolase [Acinetobacter sp. ANC 4216]|uniref:UDP-2,4-diacetamido-2,4, 6-trideoxy-beta-L-altropyranose hydrolase n=1 Tax=Acinetobacter sp. ANC 4216 TaxID=2529840 RepID=UPI00103C5CB2|nr:UDP-2,4-diacetamido-2,4,6-trideoxy-beta-L-altropyranose hydrolase [Acinetobacter sp. ANC 4216]RZJ22730.1 MAG: UDP-2,4-diacetamido-2,4,6-trideoxy-beta-L-altropyranose hydrolase [Acinetobacter sp.]TCB72052.1 UDP-2,4-diacetamido-2,4,6-trideoxy-beta-L-altropyranose hydrolase [Acinetobacter sp. ANC 4216]